MEKLFLNTKYFILNTLFFLLPFFFLTTTQEYFVTNKLYLLGFGVLLLVLISTIQIAVYRKIFWEKRPFDVPIILFITSVAISTLFSSPNKIQALLNPNFGLVMMISLAILYFYFSRNNGTMKQWNNLIIFSSIFLSLITIIFYFQPFKNIVLPQNLAFLKNPGFTPVGSQLDLAILLGFFAIFSIFHVITSDRRERSNLILNSSFLILNLLALFLTIYSLVKPNAGLINQTPTLILPPFRLSWFAALEILKNPASAIIGIGPDNFSAIFTRVKDFTYNQSPLWQINSFNVSRSAILQILTETGIFGFAGFIFLIFFVFKQFNNLTIKSFIWLFVYLIICLLFFPPSLIFWFLFFVTLGLISQQSNNETRLRSSNYDGQAMKQSIDFSNFLPIYIGIIIISLGLIGFSGYFLGRAYAAEYYFKKSLDYTSGNDIKPIYDNMKTARIINPYQERYAMSFSQINLLIADNLAKKDKEEITDADRQTISQAIQAAISEAKILIQLNPNRAQSYGNLANIYRNIIPVAQGADVWTISSYQRAIILDPVNPAYRIGLGGIYYLFSNYSDAVKVFEQTVSLKPDWPNAYYNLAWGYFQNKEYDKATKAMQNVVSLVDKKTSPKDWEKAKQELDDFKNKLADVEKQAAGEGGLNLPKEPETKLDPKLNLPPEASPEAK